MRPGLILIFPVLFLSPSCSSQYGITKASAFVRNHYAGTLRTDNRGHPRNSGVSKAYIIYVETAENPPLPEWDTAWVEDKAYSIRPVEVREDLHLGRTSTGEEVVLRVPPHKRLWQLVLSSASPVDAAPGPHPVVLKGRWKNKPFRFEIKKIQTLEATVGR